MRFRSDTNSLGHSITQSLTLTLIEKLIYSLSLQSLSHPKSSLIQLFYFARWLFIDQYLECVSMWDSRLRVVIEEHHIEFYYKKIRKCFINNFTLKKKKKKKIKVKKKGQNRTRTCSVHTKVTSSTIESHLKL